MDRSGEKDEQDEETISNKRRKALTTKGDTRKRQKAGATNNNEQIWDKCENINEFIEWCRKICDQDDTGDSGNISEDVGRPAGKKDTRYLVLDRAERLRDTAPTLIPVLMRLQELTGRNICVILITQIVWEKFRSKTGGYEPIVLNFPQYTKTETIAILERDMPQGEDPVMFMRFVDLVYDVFQRNCKDLNEIRHLVSLLFPLYVKPVKEGKSKLILLGPFFYFIFFNFFGGASNSCFHRGPGH